MDLWPAGIKKADQRGVAVAVGDLNAAAAAVVVLSVSSVANAIRTPKKAMENESETYS